MKLAAYSRSTRQATEGAGRQTLSATDESDAVLFLVTNLPSAAEYVPFIGMSAQVVHLIDY